MAQAPRALGRLLMTTRVLVLACANRPHAPRWAGAIARPSTAESSLSFLARAGLLEGCVQLHLRQRDCGQPLAAGLIGDEVRANEATLLRLLHTPRRRADRPHNGGGFAVNDLVAAG